MHCGGEEPARPESPRRHRVLTWSGWVVLLGASCSGVGGGVDTGGGVPSPPTTAGGEGVVVIRNVTYHPTRLSVPAGREVVWVFDDNGLAHTVTADDGSFTSDRRTSGEFKRAFAAPGEVAYHCEVHARMKGTVVVTP